MSVYGPLEEQVLDALWRDGESSVRGVLARLGTDHAYTTILTVLDRLHAKGAVRRRKRGVSWIYGAVASKDEVVGRAVARMMLAGSRETDPLLVGFLDAAESLDPAVVDRLAALIRDRKARRK